MHRRPVPPALPRSSLRQRRHRSCRRPPNDSIPAAGARRQAKKTRCPTTALTETCCQWPAPRASRPTPGASTVASTRQSARRGSGRKRRRSKTPGVAGRRRGLAASLTWTRRLWQSSRTPLAFGSARDQGRAPVGARFSFRKAQESRSAPASRRTLSASRSAPHASS